LCSPSFPYTRLFRSLGRSESGVDDAEQLRGVIGREGALAVQPVPQARQGLCRGEDQFTELLVAQRAEPFANRSGVLGLLHGSSLACALIDTRLELAHHDRNGRSSRPTLTYERCGIRSAA